LTFHEPFTILEQIQLLQRSILVNSYAYYELNENILSDFEYDANALQLVDLMREYPKEAKKSRYRKYFHDYCPSTNDGHYTSGFDLIARLQKNKSMYRIVSHDAHLALKYKNERREGV
jgi:NAD-dependent DNA ligase